MDLMQVLYSFGTNVAEALNEWKVKPPKDGFTGGVIVMVIKDNGGKRPQPPIAGTLNYNKDTEKWLWTDQVEQAEPIADDNEQG